MKKIIPFIPNILSIIRIILIPFILLFFILDNITVAIILTIIASISDFFDGRIARKFNVTSDLGAKLDIIADKFFGGILVISLIIKNQLYIILLVGELLIALINIIAYIKKKNPKTKYIGKIKTTILYITIIIGFISLINTNFKFLIIPFITITAIFQVLAIYYYLKK